MALKENLYNALLDSLKEQEEFRVIGNPQEILQFRKEFKIKTEE